MTQLILQDVLNAVSLGGLYALLALGISLQFGVMRLINFAHGELLMIGGYALLLFGGSHWELAVPTAVAIVVVAAVLMERVAFRPVRGADPATLLVTSFAVSFLLQSLAVFALGAASKPVPWPAAVSDSFHWGGFRVAWLDAVTIALTAVLLAALGMFLRWVPLGVQMRAAAEDFEMARLLGVRANRIVSVAFAVSGLLAGIAAVLYVAQTGTVSPSMGLHPVLVGFVASVIGGLGSLRGAVLGGFVLGAITVTLQASLPHEVRGARDAFLFGAVILVLLARPRGILGTKTGAELLMQT